MNKVPPNMRAFDLSMAQQGHPLCTRDGRPAKFIAYVPEANKNCQLVVSVNNQVVVGFATTGTFSCDPEDDLFLAPLGYCQGKPVWPKDELLYDGAPSSLITANLKDSQSFFDCCKWPIKLPVVETRMNEEEFYQFTCNVGYSELYTTVANKAIERAIADGDVIPTSVVKNLMREVCDYPNCLVQNTLNKYLEGLK